MLIYIFFQPLKIKEQKFGEIALLTMDNFTMYELQTTGLQTIMAGTKSIRYTDRYIIDDINFTDNSKEYISNILADDGIYKNDIVDLKGNVIYKREDGLTFQSNTLHYNTKTKIAQTQDKYIAYKSTNSMKGTSFVFDSANEIMKSKEVTVIYQLKESKIWNIFL